jgi:hypothetical protein
MIKEYRTPGGMRIGKGNQITWRNREKLPIRQQPITRRNTE